MKEVKEIITTIIIVITGLVLIWWLGHAIAWSMQRKDQQRAICTQETKNPAFCQAEW